MNSTSDKPEKTILPAAHAPRPYKARPVFETVAHLRFDLGGEIGRRLGAVTEQWVLPAPSANPGMLEMFRDRDRRPSRDLLPWAGEFAGKYLTHAAQIWRLTRNPRLRRHLERFVRELVGLQAPDGYLGPWPQAARLANKVMYPDGKTFPTWDTWGHYHVMLGLLLWHTETRDAEALRCAARIGDLLCGKYLGARSPRLAETGSTEMNMAPAHSLALLYERTGVSRYLDLARQLIDVEFAAKNAQGVHLAGNYLEASLAGQEFWAQPRPRWESLAAIQGLAEMYFISGEGRYRQAFEHLWWSMLKGDRHNNGGFTSGEAAQGDPYRLGAIETCCTVAWTAMSVDMLRVTGNSVVADELELTLFNSGLGLMSPSGRWVTYDTPMDGKRLASAHHIVFQARESAPELNCCAVNGPRALALTGAWALMRQDQTLVLNYYGPGELRARLRGGGVLTLVQETDYPRDNRVRIAVGLEHARRVVLRLRIPYWSTETRVAVNGDAVAGVSSGGYLALDREWQPGDTIEIVFDFRLHFWAQKPTYEPYADWETEWRVFGPVGAAEWTEAQDEALFLQHAATLPETLTFGAAGLMPKKAFSTQGLLNFDVLCGRGCERPSVYYFTEYESPLNGMLPVIFSANWLCTICVNGVRAFQGEACAYDGYTYLRLFRVELPVRRGRNIIGIKAAVHSYHRNWTASFGCARPVAGPPSGAAEASVSLTSIYRGPILLTFDSRFNAMDVENVPVLDAARLTCRPVAVEAGTVTPWLLLEAEAADGEGPVRLCDFASAGAAGTPYRSWLPVRGVAPRPFTTDNPLRSMRVGE